MAGKCGARMLSPFVAALVVVAPRPGVAAPPPCVAFDLAGGDGRRRLLSLLEQAPPGFVAPAAAAGLRRLLEWHSRSAAARPSAEAGDGDALARLGDALLAAYRQTGEGEARGNRRRTPQTFYICLYLFTVGIVFNFKNRTSKSVFSENT